VLCQAALGLKPKNGERVTVFIKTEDSPELAIGSLTMGSCDQFSLGTGLTFSSGETVTVRHNGSTSVFLTGRIEDDFDDDMMDQMYADDSGDDVDEDEDFDDDDSGDDSDSDGDEDPKARTEKLAAAAAAAAPSDDDDDDDDSEDDDDDDSDDDDESSDEEDEGKPFMAKPASAKKSPAPFKGGADVGEDSDESEDDEIGRASCRERVLSCV